MMEHPKKAPVSHSELRDPKLPVIHASSHENRAEQHFCPAPIPQSDRQHLE